MCCSNPLHSRLQMVASMEVMGARKNEPSERNTRRKKELPLPLRVSLARPVLSYAVPSKRLLSRLMVTGNRRTCFTQGMENKGSQGKVCKAPAEIRFAVQILNQIEFRIKHKNTVYLKLNTPINRIPKNLA